MKSLLIYLFIFSFLSCGSESSEEIKNAIEDADAFLTSKNCDRAIEVLNEVGMQNQHKDYLTSLASAYACKANYSSITLFTNDISDLNVSNPEDLVSSLVRFSTSDDMNGPTDDNFVFLQKAIDTLTYAGGITSASSSGRAAFFTTSELNDMNSQAVYMMLVSIGRWLHYYGNPDAAGTKGQGSGTNTCLATYTDGNAIIGLDAVASDSCNSGTNTGHPDIETALRTRRLCQGIVLFNNLVDTILILNFTGSNSGSLNSIKSLLGSLCNDASADNIPGSFNATMCDVRDQSVCEASSNSDIERFMSAIYEGTFR